MPYPLPDVLLNKESPGTRVRAVLPLTGVTPIPGGGLVRDTENQTQRARKSHSSLLLQLFSKSAMIVTSVTGKFITTL